MIVRRLLTVLLMVAAAALVVFGLRSVAAHNTAAVAARPVVPSSAATVPPPSPSASLPTPTPRPSLAVHRPVPRKPVKPVKRARPTARQIAERFVTAWLDTGGGKAAWLARLRPLTDGQLFDGFGATDIASVPAGKVRPGTRMVSQSKTLAVAHVPTSIGTLAVALALQPHGWVVANVDKAS